ncbi:MAG: hypothetical protein CBC25_07025 [Pelagibacteraceae bacterium TMED65]|nr:MAG: hypothetical protein CBC25_07025 [Pelagibacteraceae bacterium TMED65]|tara:strand:+ start:245 stop:1066 length:822 start_codon:yes stop_codon:yes gene_type:complete
MINLPKTMEDFDYFVESPFAIFEKRNFLDIKFYNELRDSFPAEDKMTKIESKGLKAALNNECPTFEKVLSNNKPWEIFYNYLNSKKIVFLFCNLIKKELDKIEERKKLKNFFFIKGGHAEYKRKLFTQIKKKITSQFYQNINLSFEFSIISNNCYIPPHADSTKSLLSWMLYFPDEGYKNSDQKKINELGTNFYKKKEDIKENFIDGWIKDKLLSEEDTISFKNNYELFYKTKFDENTLYGFIKNGRSWHDFSAFDLEKNFKRKSINININLV